MPGTLTQEQFDNLVDIIGGLYGEEALAPAAEEAAPEEAPAAAPEPVPEAMPAAAPEAAPMAPPQVELPAVPPAAPPAATPQAPEIPKSPYSDMWHKSLGIAPSRFGRKAYRPTTALATKPPKPPRTKPPTTATPHSLLYNRPYRPPLAQPFAPAQTPRTPPPDNQNELLEQVQQHVESKHGPDSGTNLAHILRTRQTDPSSASQYEAVGIGSLEELTQLLNSGRGTMGINLDEFHDDLSPFVVISQPRQPLHEGGIPAVAVGLPYADQVHTLEQAFPGVHFFPAQEAPTELRRVAAQTAKPLPAKTFKSLRQKYHKKDETTEPLAPPTAEPVPAAEETAPPPPRARTPAPPQPAAKPITTAANPKDPVFQRELSRIESAVHATQPYGFAGQEHDAPAYAAQQAVRDCIGKLRGGKSLKDLKRKYTKAEGDPPAPTPAEPTEPEE